MIKITDISLFRRKIILSVFFIFIFFTSSAQSANKLIVLLDSIANDSGHYDTRHLFAKLYSKTTFSINEGFAQNEYSDTAFINNFEIKFAQYYFDAVDHFPDNSVSYGWKAALNDSITSQCCALQKLLLAINAHINDDLLRALLSMDDKADLSVRKSDMDKIEIRILKVVDTIKNRYQHYFTKMSSIDKIGFRFAENKMKKLIIKERKNIWNRYKAVSANRLTESDILQQQFAVSKYYADKILYPHGIVKQFFKRLNKKYRIGDSDFYTKIL